jgi:hypothetical protein
MLAERICSCCRQCPLEGFIKALGFINLAQLGSISISLVIAASLFQNFGFLELQKAFADYPYSGDYIRSALAGRISSVFSSVDETIINIAILAVAKTTRKIFALIICWQGK